VGPAVLVTIVNISERKRNENILWRERAFLRKVIDIVPNLIFAKDRQGRFTLVNQAVADLYGAPPSTLIGKTDADFNKNAEEVENFRRVDLEIMNTRQEQFISEEKITDAAGKVHWLQTVKRPILDDEGVANQVLGSSTDITARKETELELGRRRNELAHLSRVTMLSELSGSLAHELNQPLAAILSNAQAAARFLAEEKPNLDEVREILQDIVSDDKRAGEVIQGLRLLLKKGERQRHLRRARHGKRRLCSRLVGMVSRRWSFLQLQRIAGFEARLRFHWKFRRRSEIQR
jgi:PAS domain S-box-containing protein